MVVQFVHSMCVEDQALRRMNLRKLFAKQSESIIEPERCCAPFGHSTCTDSFVVWLWKVLEDFERMKKDRSLAFHMRNVFFPPIFIWWYWLIFISFYSSCTEGKEDSEIVKWFAISFARSLIGIGWDFSLHCICFQIKPLWICFHVCVCACVCDLECMGMCLCMHPHNQMHCDFSFNRCFHELNIMCVRTLTWRCTAVAACVFLLSFRLWYSQVGWNRHHHHHDHHHKQQQHYVARFCTSFTRIFYMCAKRILILCAFFFHSLAWHALLHLTDTRRANTIQYFPLIVVHVRMRRGAHALAQSSPASTAYNRSAAYCVVHRHRRSQSTKEWFGLGVRFTITNLKTRTY